MRLLKPARRWLLVAVSTVAVLAFLLVFTAVGILRPTRLLAKRYEVHGVDVSSYQGDIDWDVLSKQDIHFAFIKATEGSGHVDRCFAQNYSGAVASGIRVGAYHFFSFDSAGDTQADNFIRTVPLSEDMLPPVVDVEFYGEYFRSPPDAKQVRAQLQVLLDRLTAHYGKRPILYATVRAYRLYLSGEYEEYDIWIRDVYTPPSLPDGRDWTFWQYDDHAVLDGYRGDEKYIDKNVFHGTMEEFRAY